MTTEEKYDDEVTIIGGSEWKPESGNDGTDEKSAAGGTGNVSDGQDRSRKSDRKWKIAAIVSATTLILLMVFLIGKHLYFKAQFPKSRPDREIIAALDGLPSDGSGNSQHYPSGTDASGVRYSETVSMGVTLRKYALNGLKAHFADTVPDLSDPSVYLVTRSADYRIRNDRKILIGDFIQDGEVLSSSNWRAGFMAIIDGNAQIGISRGDRVRKQVLRHDGSFFRQLAIVSAGTRCDRQFILKGKVTRCAYARDEEGRLYFLETAYPETLYGFADALVEEGFIDAVYVTGGAQPDLFYRDTDGSAHGGYVDDKPHKLVVWTK